ncbi:hypothetical protein ABC347_10790 [Sphingomonas sp. 1P06PA]|uniref:hypothetical protein n=1 Tax=Sphingomonas sp. 1P06PA TaxID=554121 RepID=UPI0039A542B3
MADDRMTGGELRALLIELLAGATGADPRYWEKLVGKVETFPMAMRPKSNWDVATTAKKADGRAFERAVDLVREQHPYVRD